MLTNKNEQPTYMPLSSHSKMMMAEQSMGVSPVKNPTFNRLAREIKNWLLSSEVALLRKKVKSLERQITLRKNPECKTTMLSVLRSRVGRWLKRLMIMIRN